MNKRMVILLTAALLVTMIIVIIVQSMLAPKKEIVAVTQKQATQILIASRNLNIGSELDNGAMEWIEWPDRAVFTGATIRKDNQTPIEAISGLLVRPIEKGEPIMHSALVKKGKGNFLSASLGKGMRAMAIRVSAESSVGGFITSGDKVDVIMTYQVRIPSIDGAKDAAASLVSRNASQTVLNNIRVLAVDQESKPKDNAKIARTVTLEVDAKGAETLALSSSMGELSLVLRKLGDETIASETKQPLTTDVLISDVLRQVTGGQGGGAQMKIRVYNGSQINEQVVRARFAPMK